MEESIDPISKAAAATANVISVTVSTVKAAIGIKKRKPRKFNYRLIAKKRWPKAAKSQYRLDRISGNGRYAVVTPCKELDVSLHETLESAQRTKAWLDSCGCCGGCNKYSHEIVDLGEQP
jgi:hypothetical protein